MQDCGSGALVLPLLASRAVLCDDGASAGGRPMALKRMVLQIGMGTDIRGRDYTKAAVRALRDALWHNSLSVANALGQDTDAMQVEVTIGVPHPELVDKAAVLAILPHGTGTVSVVEGGLEIANDEGTSATIVANAAAVVRLDLPEARISSETRP